MHKLIIGLILLLLALGGCSDDGSGDGEENGEGNGDDDDDDDGDDNGVSNDNSDYVTRDEDEIIDLGVDNGTSGGEPADLRPTRWRPSLPNETSPPEQAVAQDNRRHIDTGSPL